MSELLTSSFDNLLKKIAKAAIEERIKNSVQIKKTKTNIFYAILLFSLDVNNRIPLVCVLEYKHQSFSCM